MGGTDMPEKMTEEEAQISRAIRLVRKAKEVLQEEGRETLPLEIEDPDVKTKKPKAEKADTEIENNTGTHSGYGLAGDTFGKADRKNLPLDEDPQEYYRQYRDTYGLYMDNAMVISKRINIKLEEILDEFRNDDTMEIAERMYGMKKIEEMSETIRTMQGTISRFNRERRAGD